MSLRFRPVVRALQVLGLNAVPAAGYFGDRWSPSTTLFIYWAEGILIVGLIAARIVLHRRATNKRGHYRGLPSQAGARSSGTLLRSYLTASIPFNLAHGVFLVLILFVFLPQLGGEKAAGVNLVDFRLGFAGVTIFLAIGFLVDLAGLKQRSFYWIDQMVQRSMGRILVIHLSIIFGMWALAVVEAPRVFFAVFIGLKTLSDFGSMLPRSQPTEDPPSWLNWMRRLGRNRQGKTFEDSWRGSHWAEVRIQEENEQVVEKDT